jgi:putative ABC transport system permease protein
LLGLIGGLIGLLLGFLLSKSVEIIGTVVLGSSILKADFSLFLMVGALLFSFVVGTVSGVAPAYQASKLNPVEALRK